MGERDHGLARGVRSHRLRTVRRWIGILACAGLLTGCGAPAPSAGTAEPPAAVDPYVALESAPPAIQQPATPLARTTAATEQKAQHSPPASVSTPVTADSTGEAREVNLRMVFVPGAVKHYTGTIRMTLSGPSASGLRNLPPFNMKMGFRLKVLEVYDDGSARVEMTLDPVVASGGGQQAVSQDLDGLILRMRMAPDGSTSEPEAEIDGEIVSLNELAGLPTELADLSDDPMMFTYPGRPIRVGESFEKERRFNLGPILPGGTVMARFTLADVMTTNAGLEVARVDEKVSMTGMELPGRDGVEFRDGTLTVNGSSYVSTADGWMQSGTQQLAMSLHATGPDPRISGTFNVKAETSFKLEE